MSRSTPDMERFRFIALDAAGEVRQGEIQAASQDDARAQLRSLEYAPVRLRRAWGMDFLTGLNREITFGKTLGRADLAMFLQALSSLIDAGLGLDRALGTVAELLRKPAAKDLVIRARERVQAGNSLSASLAAEGKEFAPELIAVIRAGEASGRLAPALAELGEYHENINALRAKIRTSMYYPAFLLAMAIAAVVVIVTVVLPEFEALFRSAGAELPALTRVVRAVGLVLVNYYWMILLFPVVIAAAIGLAMRSAAGRMTLGRLWLGMPLFGGLIQRIETARLARVLGAQLRGGVPLDAALKTSEQALKNAVMVDEIAKIRSAVRKGRRIGPSLGTARVFPDMFVQLVRVGEESGRLPDMLLKAARIFDRQVELSLDRLVALVVPVVTLFMGLVVAAIVFSVVAAILGLNQLV